MITNEPRFVKKADIRLPLSTRDSGMNTQLNVPTPQDVTVRIFTFDHKTHVVTELPFRHFALFVQII